eukprot:6671423-Pyramimonas_sp.AAC.1
METQRLHVNPGRSRSAWANRGRPRAKRAADAEKPCEIEHVRPSRSGGDLDQFPRVGSPLCVVV